VQPRLQLCSSALRRGAQAGSVPQDQLGPFAARAEAEMTANVLSRIFTIEIGDTPTLTFNAQNLREAQELCHEQ
jgi:hypothetical protein